MTKMKKSAVAFGVACALTLTGGLAALKTLPAFAEEVTEGGYYGKHLANPLAVAFYDELVQMTKDPDGEGPELSEFRMGANHTVTNETLLAAIEDFEGGDRTLVKQFGAALDSFRYDYADLFYINFDLLTFDITKAEIKDEEPGDEEGGQDGPEAVDEEGSQDPQDPNNPTDPKPEGPKYEYVFTIGAGRGQSYFIDGVTLEEINAMLVES